MQGLGWGEDSSKARAAPDSSSVEWQGGTAGSGMAAGSGAQADAQGDWISVQESQRFIPGSGPLGPSWVTSGEPQTHKSWGVCSGSVTAQC